MALGSLGSLQRAENEVDFAYQRISGIGTADMVAATGREALLN